MAEEVLLEAGSVKITPARVVCVGSTYVVANITSVKAVSDNRFRLGGIGVAVVGFFIALGGTATTIFVGLSAMVGGTLLAVFGKETHVVITTGAGEQEAFTSRDEKAALAVASAINLAIMKRSESGR